MNKIEELEKQMAAIAKAIEAEKNKGREEALETVRTLIKQYSISQREVKSVLLVRKPRVTKGVALKRVATKTASGKRLGRPPSKKWYFYLLNILEISNKTMFSFLDFLFSEERTKNSLTRSLGQTESSFVQGQVKDVESDRRDINFYEDDEVNTAIVHTRQDVILLVVILQRTNILLRWIRFLLLCIVILICYKFFLG